jgi:LysM repeat protein
MYPQCPAGTFCHVIQPGEPLQEVANRYQVSLEALYEVNPELNPNLYYEGQVIYIPVAGEQDDDFDDDDFDWDDWDYDYDSYYSTPEQRRPPGPPRGASQGPPSGPPPGRIPAEPPRRRGLFLVDPGAIRGCLFRFTYIWENNGQSYWAYPTFVGPNSVAGWRYSWRRWVYFGVDLRAIRSFQC